MQTTGSQIFEGYKSVGLVSGSVAHMVRYVDKLHERRVVTVCGNTFLTFNDRLRLIETCVAHDSDIQVLTSDSKFIYTAADNEIFGWKYGHKWKSRSFAGCLESTVECLLPFGPHLIATDSENILRVWEIRSQELTLTIPMNPESFRMTCLVHPATYINKILIGSVQGSLQMWNLRTQTLIHTFSGWQSRVTRLCQAPAIDIMAIGLENGCIFIHNLRLDETLMKFSQEWGSVETISFRSDGKPFMATTSTSGHLALWNLDHKRLESQMRNIHSGPIVGTTFIDGEALMVTNSPDNSLKIWCFDQSDSTGRVLYQREGHRRGPTKIRFHGFKGQYVLSAGLDSTLRAFSIFSERLNRSLGVASHNRKLSKKRGNRYDVYRMKPIIDFTAETTREKEWDGIAAVHRRQNIATTWSFNESKMGRHKLMHNRFVNKHNIVALCVCLSCCGNFVIIGYNTGHIDRYNIQSGIHRAAYGNKAHSAAVRGIASDGLNQLVISGGNDSLLKFWRFNGKELLANLTLDAPVNQLVFHKESSLLAVSLDNFYVNVVDCETRRIIRILGPHGNRITDMTFNRESRWLITSSMDSIVRVWDLPSGLLVDAFRVSTPCISLSLSPTGEFLATAHTDDLGIYLWANISLYAPVSLRPLNQEDCEPVLLEMPVIRSDEEDNEEEEEECQRIVEDSEQQSDELMDTQSESYKSPEQLAENLITLSSLPESKWKNLLNLDLIKKRNKPKEPVRKPESAPFFLPTVAGIEPKFLVTDNPETNASAIDTKIRDYLTPLSSFGELIISCHNQSDCNPLMDCLKSMSQSAIDAELRSLSTQSIGSPNLMLYFLESLETGLKTYRDFELIQSYLSLFLKIHVEDIVINEKLKTLANSLSETSDQLWDRLSNEFNKSLCLTNYLRSAIL
ncbi:WD repeat-containing protein 36-like [Oppia nitens]|uniref:WD repeat-containing protein 36-like n=1 Tax=Oppia nitens TaxID=1686743 RepID=UPI0023DB9E1D|nr:WD repeat-containing protein 36-like [Oppia nitens]